MPHEGAFELQDVPEREQRYLRYYGQPLPLISKMMLSMQDNPSTTREFYRQHLSKAQESAAFRKVIQALPIKDDADISKPSRNTGYRKAKEALEAKPKISSAAFYLKQCERVLSVRACPPSMPSTFARWGGLRARTE